MHAKHPARPPNIITGGRPPPFFRPSPILRFCFIIFALVIVGLIFLLHHKFSATHIIPVETIRVEARYEPSSAGGEEENHPENHRDHLTHHHHHHHHDRSDQRRHFEKESHLDDGEEDRQTHNRNDDDKQTHENHSDDDGAPAGHDRKRIQMLFMHPDAVCGTKKPRRMNVVVSNNHLQHKHQHRHSGEIRAPPILDLSKSFLDADSQKHPVLWPPALSTAESKADVISTGGVYCAAVTDSKSSCPTSMAVLTVAAAFENKKEQHGRDASEFAVPPFRFKSIRDIAMKRRARETNTHVTRFASCEAPDAIQSKGSSVLVKCKAALTASSSSSRTTRVRFHWPPRMPLENPFFPVVTTDVDAEEAMQRVSQNRAKSAAAKNSSTVAFHPPQLRLSFLEPTAAARSSEAIGVMINGKGVTKVLLNNNNDGDEEAAAAGKEDDGMNRANGARAWKGETVGGVIHNTILSSVEKKLYRTVPLSDFDHVVSTGAEFAKLFTEELHENDGGDGDAGADALSSAKTVRVAKSIVVTSADLRHSDNNNRLRIGRGTVIACDRGVTITFKFSSRENRVEVEGTPEAPVLFVNARHSENWGGIVFLEAPNADDGHELSEEQQRKQFLRDQQIGGGGGGVDGTEKSWSFNRFRHTFVVGTGGAKTTVKGVGTHIKDACPAFVVGPRCGLSLDSVYIIGGKGSGITSGKRSIVRIRSSVFFDLAQGGEFVGSSTAIEQTHALHMMLRQRVDEFRDEDNDGFYFRDGAARLRDSVVFGSRDDCIDTASSKHNKDPPSRLIIENTLLANCQHEGLALSGSVGAAPRSVQILDSTIKFAQQGIENGHTPATHSTLVEGVNIEDCGIGIRLGDNYVLDIDGPLEVAADVALHRCQLPFLNLMMEHRHSVWQIDGRQQNPKTVKVHPDTVVDGISARSSNNGESGGGVSSYRSFCGKEMFSLLSSHDANVAQHQQLQQQKHEQLMIL